MDRPAQPGDVLLGKYRVERVLGQGGMGFVVAARHVELGQLYAIKFLLPEVLAHHEALERFLREARAAAQLKSEHVARVHDVGRMQNGAPYMILEYLEGTDLKVHLSRQGPLPVEDAVTFVLHACDAIAEAHALGIIHRDLKPANLFLVRRRNGSSCVKVLDFGISKHTGTEEVDLTNTNMSLGSPLYMSPEQMSKTKAVDGRTDIWALGVILYELLTGNSPFRAGSMLEVAAKVLQQEPRPLREVRPDVPEGLVSLIGRCLRKHRDDRWTTVEEFVQALEEFVPRVPASRLPMSSVTNVESMATSAQTDVPSIMSTIPLGAPLGEPTSMTFGQTGKPKAIRRHRMAVAGGLVVAGLVLTGGVWMMWGGLSRQKATHEAAAQASVERQVPTPLEVTTFRTTPEIHMPLQTFAPSTEKTTTPMERASNVIARQSTPRAGPTTRPRNLPEVPAKPQTTTDKPPGDIVIEVPTPPRDDESVPPAP
jgi:serine/threonine-protein kinase